jgi:hypothetical protein
MFRRVSYGLIAIALAVAAWPPWAAAGPESLAPAGLGDVDRDGGTNVMDVQATIAQALGNVNVTAEADVDENTMVNVFDVQHQVNTVLRTGGLVQRVRGRLDYDRSAFPYRIIVHALSRDGHTVNVPVNRDTGVFVMVLRAKTAWSFAFVALDNAGNPQFVGILGFRIGDHVTTLLPVPDLSRGDDIVLGVIPFAARMLAPRDIRAMLGAINGRLDDRDANENGIPDILEPLISRVRSATDVPAEFSLVLLERRIARCIEIWLNHLTTPDLTDANQNDVPDFIDPLLDCIRNNVVAWYEEQGESAPPDDVIDRILAHVRAGIRDWMRSLNEADLLDDDDNGIPDYMEAVLGNTSGPNAVDADGNGEPDFAEDSDGDGVPNFQDADAQLAGDCDGDGLPNDKDTDDDNDGVPDYADDTPCGDGSTAGSVPNDAAA